MLVLSDLLNLGMGLHDCFNPVTPRYAILAVESWVSFAYENFKPARPYATPPSPCARTSAPTRSQAQDTKEY